MSAATTIRGRRRIAHDLGVSERTVSRWARRGRIAVAYEPPECNRVMVLPKKETASTYRAVVAVLNDRWRVIECRDGIQWILQRRGSPETSRADDWRGRSYCRTKEALLRLCGLHAGAIDPAALAVLSALPKTIGGVA